MKLKNIKIENFRTIEKLSISIVDMLIMVGENNSGKSNIFRALDLFYQESVRGIDEEFFCFKDCKLPISISLVYDRLEDDEKSHPILKNWIYNDAIKVKKVIQMDENAEKCKMQFFGWQAKPVEPHFDLNRFDEYKSRLKEIVEDNALPDYFRNDKGSVTQASYKAGVKEHYETGLVEMGEPGWAPNPGGYKEVFGSLLPRFYLVPCCQRCTGRVKDNTTNIVRKIDQ